MKRCAPSCLINPNKRICHMSKNAPEVFGFGVELRSSRCDFSNVSICFYDEHELSRDANGTFVRFQLPVARNVKTGEFEMFGSFCSLECACAFLHQKYQRPFLPVDKIQPLLHLYAKQILKLDHRIEFNIAHRPHKFVLQRYGGPMSIDDFRSKWCNSIRLAVYRVMPSFSGFKQVQVIVDEYLHAPRISLDKPSFPTTVNKTKPTQPDTQKSTTNNTSICFPPRKMPVYLRKQTLAVLIK